MKKHDNSQKKSNNTVYSYIKDQDSSFRTTKRKSRRINRKALNKRILKPQQFLQKLSNKQKHNKGRIRKNTKILHTVCIVKKNSNGEPSIIYSQTLLSPIQQNKQNIKKEANVLALKFSEQVIKKYEYEQCKQLTIMTVNQLRECIIQIQKNYSQAMRYQNMMQYQMSYQNYFQNYFQSYLAWSLMQSHAYYGQSLQ